MVMIGGKRHPSNVISDSSERYDKLVGEGASKIHMYARNRTTEQLTTMGLSRKWIDTYLPAMI